MALTSKKENQQLKEYGGTTLQSRSKPSQSSGSFQPITVTAKGFQHLLEENQKGTSSLHRSNVDDLTGNNSIVSSLENLTVNEKKESKSMMKIVE